MYTIKIQRIAEGGDGMNTVLPMAIKSVGAMPTRELAERFAAMWRQYEFVAVAWIEHDPLPN